MKFSDEFSFFPANEWHSKLAIGKDHLWLLRVYQNNSEMNKEFTEIQQQSELIGNIS